MFYTPWHNRETHLQVLIYKIGKTNMDIKVGYGIIVTQEIWLQTADYANNALLLEFLVVKSQNVVVLFVNITIIGTCSRTGDMYFIHTCTWISNVICLVLFVSSEVMWEVIVNFVDIGGIGDYHSLSTFWKYAKALSRSQNVSLHDR